MSALPPVRHPWAAALYDRLDKLGEKRFAPYRQRTAGGASGRVIEVGGGTGANLRYYDWSRVDSLDFTEPDPHMLGRAVPKRDALPPEARAKVRLHQSPAESLPFDDVSFDTAVVTLVLCTVQDPARAIAELRRVLKPDGQLRIIEHVAAEGLIGSFQRLIQPAHGWWAAGCQLRRHTEQALRDAGFVLEVEERLMLMPYAPAFVGVARKE